MYANQRPSSALKGSMSSRCVTLMKRIGDALKLPYDATNFLHSELRTRMEDGQAIAQGILSALPVPPRGSMHVLDDINDLVVFYRKEVAIQQGP